MGEGFITAEELIVKARNNGSCALVSHTPLWSCRSPLPCGSKRRGSGHRS